MRHPWFVVRELLVGALLILFYVPAAYLAYYLGAPLRYIVVATVFFLIFQYWLGRRRALKSVDARPIPDEYEWIKEDTAELADGFNMKTPDIYFGDIKGPNAFAIGRQRSGVIVLSPLIVELLSREELRGVLAHELSHLHSRDTLFMVAGQGIAAIISNVVTILLVPLPDDWMHERRKDPLAFFAGAAVHSLVMSVVFVISRQREYIADADAKEVVGEGVHLATALNKVSTAYSTGKFHHPPEAAETLCIASDISLPAFGSTHPPMTDRIERLLENEPYEMTGGDDETASASDN